MIASSGFMNEKDYNEYAAKLAEEGAVTNV